MKYLEELQHGDCFSAGSSNFILTCDSRSGGKRLCINLINGETRWFKSNEIVDKLAIFYTDKDGNIIALKETKKDDFT